MSSRRASAIGSLLSLTSAALLALSCHVTDVTAPIGAPNVRLSFSGDSQMIAGTRELPLVTVSSGATALAGQRVRFGSSDTNVVAISRGGDSLVALRLGRATITAWVENSLFPDSPPSATRTIVVVPKAFSIVPGLLQLVSLGDTATLSAAARDANNLPLDGVGAQWTLARPADSTIIRLAAGRVTARGAGTADVLALFGTDTARAVVTVAQRLARFAFASSGYTLDALRAESTLVVTPLDAGGSVIAAGAPTPVFESADSTTVTVDGTGRVRAVRNGTTYVRARRPDGNADSTLLVVDQRAVRVTILPPRRTTLGTRDTLTVDAVAVDRLGNSVTDGAPRWSSSYPAVIDFGQGAAGSRVLLNSYAPGPATITAVLDAQRDSVAMTVVNEPAFVRVTPDSAIISAARDSTQMRATVYNAAGDRIDSASVNWATPDTLVARVASPGWFVAVDSGRARVIARTLASNGILLADTSVVVVTNAPRVVDLTLAVDTLSVLGMKELLPIRILNAINDTLSRTRVHWETRDAQVAAVSSIGEVTATGSGATWVVAWADSARDSTRIVVYNVAASVSIDGVANGVPDTIPVVGASISHTATVRNDAGAIVAGYPVTWSSTIPAVATVSNGVITATGFGSTNVIVRAGAAADTVVVVVKRPTHWHVDGARAGTERLGTFARPFATIQSGADAASAGDTLVVAPSVTYRETVSIAKTLTVAGDSAGFLAGGRDPNRLPAIVNASGSGGFLVSAGTFTLGHFVVRHTADGPALAAADADVNLSAVYVNPGSADTPRGSGILIERAPQAARLDSVVVEGVIGYAIRIRSSAGVRVARTRVRGVRVLGGGGREDGVGIAVTGGRGAMIGGVTLRTTDGAELLLAGTTDATVNFSTFTGERQLVLVDGATGLTTIADNVFDLARPADDAYTGTSVTDGRAGLTVRGSAGVQSIRNRFRDATGVTSQMDAIRLDSARTMRVDSTRFAGGRRAVRSQRSSWTLTGSRVDSVALAIEAVGDTLALTDDTLASAGAGCASLRFSEATLTRITGAQCGVGDSPAFSVVGGAATFDGLSVSGSNPRAVLADSVRRVILRRATILGPGAWSSGIAGSGGVQLAGDSVSVVGSFVTKFPDRAAMYLSGGVVRVDSTVANRSRMGLQLGTIPAALNVRDDDLYDADSAAFVGSGTVANVWWGDGRGPAGTTTASVGDTIVGTVVATPFRTLPFRPGVAASRMLMLRGDGQSVVTNGSVYVFVPYALSVRVTDADGLPVRNVAVNFVVNSSGRIDFGSGVKSVNVITNDAGIAETNLRIRDRGTFTITATAPGVSDTIIFTESGT
ncbi:MAG: hypothetical protein HOQ34_15380 [Gemmatimonadaceae bacterium]|nr:hypothetical protein [Gemmatimonadaceae bacterium]